MKNIIILLILSFSFSGCEDNGFNSRNPYLSDFPFSVYINLNFPQYSNLVHPGNSVRLLDNSFGPRGVIIINSGGNGYLAFDAACPNHEFKSCSILELHGIYAKCPCDGLDYLLLTGLAEGGSYPLKQYRIENMGNNTLRVYNY